LKKLFLMMSGQKLCKSTMVSSRMGHNGAWKLVDPPFGTNAIDCKYVYKNKNKLDGSLAMHKVRLVAKGYAQKEGIVSWASRSFGWADETPNTPSHRAAPTSFV